MKFNVNDLRNIHKLIIERKLDLARTYLEEYKTKYKKDHILCRRYDALLKAYEGYTEEAIEILKENILIDNTRHSDSDDAYYLVILLSKKGRYEEAYSYLKHIDLKKLMENTRVAYKKARKMINF